MRTRATILSAGVPGDHLEVTDAEIAALKAAAVSAADTSLESTLLELLHKLDPGVREGHAPARGVAS